MELQTGYDELKQKVWELEKELAKQKQIEKGIQRHVQIIRRFTNVDSEQPGEFASDAGKSPHKSGDETASAELISANEQLQREIQKRTQAEEALKMKTVRLEEANTALNILLKKRAEDKKETEEKVLFNLKEMIMPYLEKLKNSGLNKKQKICAEIIESNLNDIVSPFVRKLSRTCLKLTPSEIQVANLIRQDKCTKEIAEVMNLSARTVESYRDSIRKKVGIKHKKINLKTYLLSLQ
jgi:DNA-binding CsgD family transcriptional regulator